MQLFVSFIDGLSLGAFIVGPFWGLGVFAAFSLMVSASGPHVGFPRAFVPPRRGGGIAQNRAQPVTGKRQNRPP